MFDIVVDQITVLHVDDDREFAAMAAAFLKREDDRFVVEQAEHASAGLEMLSDHTVDCVVSDYDMLEMDGIEFLQVTRERYPDLPFILFTGKGSEDVASEAISAGTTDYLQKGGSAERFELLANRVTNAVAQNRAEQRAAETTQRYDTLFTHTTNAIAAVEFRNGEPIITDINPAFEAYFVPQGDDVVGRSLDEVVTGTDAQREQAQTITDRTKAGETVSWEVTRDTVDGPREFRLQAVPIDPDVTADFDTAFAVYTDITRTDRNDVPN